MSEISGLSYVKATDLNRGKASSCIKKVHDDNCDTIILKNSEPYAVIISVKRYEEMLRIESQQNRMAANGERLTNIKKIDGR